jgi:hypothetical protein
LRSTGVAHRKGDAYEQHIDKNKIDPENYKAEFDETLVKMTNMLKSIMDLAQQFNF